MPQTIDKKQFNHELVRLALPIALQSLMLASVAAADALMLGQVAQNEMTAVSLATQIQFVQNMFLSATTAAGTILGAQYWGKGDKRTIGDIFDLMLRYCGIVSAVFFLGCELTPGLLMQLYTGDGELISIGSAYLRIAGWSYLITGVSQCYLSVMKITDHVRPAAFISCGAVVMNVVLNGIFIFGLFGIPAMNARGAAVATTVSRIIELLMCIFISAKGSYIRPAFDRFFTQTKLLKKDFARQCLPLLGGALCWGVGFSAYTAIVGHMGTDPAAANSVSAVIRDLMCCVCNGIAGAAGIMVGNELEPGNWKRVKHTASD